MPHQFAFWLYVVLWLLIILGGVATAQTTTPPPPVDLINLALGIVVFVLEFGGGAIAAALSVWLVDALLRLIPPLRPFRDALLSWVKWLIDEVKRRQALSAVVSAGQMYRADIAAAPTPEDTERAKTARYATAETLLAAKGINRDEAGPLIEEAVARLKNGGINP